MDLLSSITPRELVTELKKQPGIIKFMNESLYFYVFFGQPGSGKTMLAHAFADDLIKYPFEKPYKFVVLEPDYFRSSKIGETETKIQNFFKAIQEDEKNRYIVFIDEMDNVFKERTGNTPEHLQSVTAQFQITIEKKYDKLILLGCSNYFTTIEGAIRRRITETYHIVSQPFTPENLFFMFVKPTYRNSVEFYLEYLKKIIVDCPITLQASNVTAWFKNAKKKILGSEKLYIKFEQVLFISDNQFDGFQESTMEQINTFTYNEYVFLPGYEALNSTKTSMFILSYADYENYLVQNNVFINPVLKNKLQKGKNSPAIPKLRKP